MAQLMLGFLISCLIFLVVDVESTIECGPNETEASCGRYCEPTCSLPDQKSCKIHYRVCMVGCRCKEGLFREEATDQCVTKIDCKVTSDERESCK